MAETLGLVWAGSRVEISPSKVAEFLRSSDGPILRRFLVYGDRVKATTIASLRSGFPRDFLGPTIVKRVVMASNGPHVIVGSDRTKTLRHGIDGNPLLVFFWPKVGATVFFPHVDHPGSEMGEYLLKRLTESLSVLRGAL